MEGESDTRNERKILAWVNKKSYKIAYKSGKRLGNVIDSELECRKCGNTEWVYSKNTGTKTLGNSQMKFKCSECGDWFICNNDQVTQLLGQ